MRSRMAFRCLSYADWTDPEVFVLKKRGGDKTQKDRVFFKSHLLFIKFIQFMASFALTTIRWSTVSVATTTVIVIVLATYTSPAVEHVPRSMVVASRSVITDMDLSTVVIHVSSNHLKAPHCFFIELVTSATATSIVWSTSPIAPSACVEVA